MRILRNSSTRRWVSFVWASALAVTTFWIVFQATPKQLVIYGVDDKLNDEALSIPHQNLQSVNASTRPNMTIITHWSHEVKIETSTQNATHSVLQLRQQIDDRIKQENQNVTTAALQLWQQIEENRKNSNNRGGKMTKEEFLKKFAERKSQNLRSGQRAGRRSAAPSQQVPPSTPPKILLFITTIFSEYHVKMFSCCWPKLLHNSKLLPNVDVMIFSNNETTIPEAHLQSTQSLFANNPSYQIQFPSQDELNSVHNTSNEWDRFQTGANLGPKLAFEKGWFDAYDWIIRINPDVLVRNSTWLHDKLYNDRTAEAIIVKCASTRIHTDFFAVRPKALIQRNNGDTPFSKLELEPWNRPDPPDRQLLLNHEATAFKYFALIIKAGKHRLLPDAEDSNGRCRVRGEHSSVYHGHDSCKDDSNVCDALEGYNIS